MSIQSMIHGCTGEENWHGKVEKRKQNPEKAKTQDRNARAYYYHASFQRTHGPSMKGRYNSLHVTGRVGLLRPESRMNWSTRHGKDSRVLVHCIWRVRRLVACRAERHYENDTFHFEWKRLYLIMIS
ncbi:hypothetical protein O6H91_09G044600 [Diphasiastrum complanatum]|uniref:Uncharacterized protein n=1 Tax=Diphasiastrum complanatum TaxID=34168 RepID=A0ACC2CNM5_DIPCM|nr:hypothetical protein O6H91_09G044600 [Diphasiastrum complanatum]